MRIIWLPSWQTLASRKSWTKNLEVKCTDLLLVQSAMWRQRSYKASLMEHPLTYGRSDACSMPCWQSLCPTRTSSVPPRTEKMLTTSHYVAGYNKQLHQSRIRWASSQSKSMRVTTVNTLHKTTTSIWTCKSSMQLQTEMKLAQIWFRKCYRLTLERDLRSSRCSATHSSSPLARSDLIEEKRNSLNELRAVYKLSIKKTW